MASRHDTTAALRREIKDLETELGAYEFFAEVLPDEVSEAALDRRAEISARLEYLRALAGETGPEKAA